MTHHRHTSFAVPQASASSGDDRRAPGHGSLGARLGIDWIIITVTAVVLIGWQIR